MPVTRVYLPYHRVNEALLRMSLPICNEYHVGNGHVAYK